MIAPAQQAESYAKWCVRLCVCILVCARVSCIIGVMSVRALLACRTVQAPLLSRGALTKRKHADNTGGKQDGAITRQANGDGPSDAPCSGRLRHP